MLPGINSYMEAKFKDFNWLVETFLEDKQDLLAQGQILDQRVRVFLKKKEQERKAKKHRKKNLKKASVGSFRGYLLARDYGNSAQPETDVVVEPMGQPLVLNAD